MGISSTVWPEYTNFGGSPPANRPNRGMLGRAGRNLHDGMCAAGPIVSHDDDPGVRSYSVHEIFIPASRVFDQG